MTDAPQEPETSSSGENDDLEDEVMDEVLASYTEAIDDLDDPAHPEHSGHKRPA